MYVTDNAPMNTRTAAGEALRRLMDSYDNGRGIGENALSRATFDHFGEEEGIPQPTIHRILTGKTKEPKSSTLEKLAIIFGVTEDQLRGKQPLPGVDESGAKYGAALAPVPSVVEIPALTWEQAAHLDEVLPQVRKGELQVGTRTTSKDVTEDAFVLPVQGDAMQGPGPFSFQDGMEITVDPGIEARHGSFVVATAEGYQTPIFRQLEIEGGVRRLKPLNTQGYNIYEMKDTDEIIGKVIEYRGALP